jgi:hypothetical protein
MTDDEIVDAEIVEGAGEADDVIESLDDMADDATIDDADVVETSTAGEAGIADPEVIALLRDTTGEMARRPRAGEPESGAGSPSTSPASQPVPAAGTGPSAPAPPRGPTSPIETSAHAAAPAEPTGLPDSP